MDITIGYFIVGYFWGLICENRSRELNYPKESILKCIAGFVFNAAFWPISMVMGYFLEQYLARQKPNNWR